MLGCNKYFYKNKLSKLCFVDRVAVLNDFIYQTGGSTLPSFLPSFLTINRLRDLGPGSSSPHGCSSPAEVLACATAAWGHRMSEEPQVSLRELAQPLAPPPSPRLAMESVVQSVTRATM
jgi:hypothetical protein